ncbi:MAG: CPBP family intramembrane metalloprotease [Ignavibacteria bacterium]|nr:CPBP family intramembrane metalloprotease [Ignavibacteria bacterium]
MSDLENNANPEDQKDSKNQTEANRNRKSIHDIYPLISPVAAAFLGLIGGFFLYQFIGGMLTLVIFGFDLESAPVNSLRLLTVAGQVLFILLPALLFAKWIYGDVSDIISLKLPEYMELTLFSIGIIILIPLLQSYLYIQNYFIEYLAANSEMVNSIKNLFDSLNELVDKTYGNLLKADSIPEMFLVIIVIAIVPSVCEEVMFRGYIQRSFEFKMKPIWAILITAIFFGVYHFNPYGLFPLIVLGFYFGFAAYISKSLIVPIFLHFLNNFGAVILYFIIGDDELISTDVTDSTGLEANIFLFFLLALLFTIVIFMIKKYYFKIRTV